MNFLVERNSNQEKQNVANHDDDRAPSPLFNVARNGALGLRRRSCMVVVADDDTALKPGDRDTNVRGVP
jgi:hypothetical protein